MSNPIPSTMKPCRMLRLDDDNVKCMGCGVEIDHRFTKDHLCDDFISGPPELKVTCEHCVLEMHPKLYLDHKTDHIHKDYVEDVKVGAKFKFVLEDETKQLGAALGEDENKELLRKKLEDAKQRCAAAECAAKQRGKNYEDEAKQLGAALGEDENKELLWKKLEDAKQRCAAAERAAKLRCKNNEELRRKNYEELRRQNEEELSRQRVEELKTRREKRGKNPSRQVAQSEQNDRIDDYDVDSIMKEFEEMDKSGKGSGSKKEKTKQKTGKGSQKHETGKKEVVEKDVRGGTWPSMQHQMEVEETAGRSSEDTLESLKNEEGQGSKSSQVDEDTDDKPLVSTVDKANRLCTQDAEDETDLPEKTSEEIRNKAAEEIRLKENETVKAVKPMTEAAEPEEKRTEASREKTKNLAASERSKAGEKEVDVFDIFLDGLKQVHAGYLEAFSTSDDASLSATRLETCTNLAIQLSNLIDTASEESYAALLSIVKAGICYAFGDAPSRLSFLTCAVLIFASELPRAGISDTLKNVEDRAMDLNIVEDSSEWIDYFHFVNALHEMSSAEQEDETAQEDETLGNSEDTIRIPRHEIGHIGESLAYRYFCKTCSDKRVFWLNEHRESRRPYDIILKAADNTQEFVEVKTSTVEHKEWFYISPNELAFALRAGKSYTIAQVDLSDSDNPMIIVHRDFEQLLRSRFFQLMVVRGAGRP